MLKEFLILSFILLVLTVILAVIFPPVILEPIAWLLNTELNVHKYGQAGVGNQSASYFDFYVLVKDGLYGEISVLMLGLLSLLIFIPAGLLALTLLSIHLKAKLSMKENRQGYLSSVLDVFELGKIKAPFWLIFCPMVVTLYFIHTQYYKEVTHFATLSLDSLSDKRLYQPAVVRGKGTDLVQWSTYISEIHPRLYRKDKGSFISQSQYKLNLTASDYNGKPLFRFERDAKVNLQVLLLENRLILLDSMAISIIDTDSMSEIPLDLTAISKQKSASFTSLNKIVYTPTTHGLVLTDDHGNNVNLNLLQLMNSSPAQYSSVRLSRIKGKDHRVKKLYFKRHGEVIESSPLIKPHILFQDMETTLVSSSDSLTDTAPNKITAFNQDLELKWKVPFQRYHPYLQLFENMDCSHVSVITNDNIIAISYYFMNITCSTDLIDKVSGKYLGRSYMGNLEMDMTSN